MKGTSKMDRTAAPAGPPRQQGYTGDVPITDRAPAAASSRRRWPLFTVLIVVAAVAVLGVQQALTSAGDRHQVIAVARDVPAGTKLSEQDLTTASVSADAALKPLAASEASDVVGQRAAVDLKAGTMLTESQLRAGSGLGDDQQLVGVEVKRSQVPSDALHPGDRVAVVTTPAEGGALSSATKPADTFDATVVSVGRLNASGVLPVNLAVDEADGPAIAERSSLGRLALVRQPKEG